MSSSDITYEYEVFSSSGESILLGGRDIFQKGRPRWLVFGILFWSSVGFCALGVFIAVLYAAGFIFSLGFQAAMK
jgi:hypothetical protein